MGLSNSSSPGSKPFPSFNPSASRTKKPKRFVSSGGISSQAKQHLGQLAKGTFEELKSQPGGMAKSALEQVGIGGNQAEPKPPSVEGVKKKIKEREAMDKARSEQQITQIKGKLEEEIKYWQQVREEQLRQRREPPEMTPEQAEAAKQAEGTPLVAPGEGEKPKKGGFLMGMKRKKTQVENVGGRVSG